MIAFVLFFSYARALSYETSEETDCWSGSGVRGKGDAQDVYQNYDKKKSRYSYESDIRHELFVPQFICFGTSKR